MRIRNHVKVGTDMQELDIVTEQRNAARTPVVPGIAVFEGVDAAQPEPPGVVAGQTHRGADNGFIEKLQTVILTGSTGRIDADFTRFQAIQPEPDADACFLVRTDEGNPGYPMMRLPSGTSIFGSLLIDCTQVITAIDRNITRRPGKAIDPDLDATPALLQMLRVAIGGKSARRFSRTRFRPRGDLVSGFGAVLSFLDGNTFSRRSVDASSRYDGRDYTSSEWAMIDESPDGFLLRFIKGEKRNLGAGDLVALQPRESSKIHVCLVRRISSSQIRLEVGLQLMSPQVSVVDIVAEETPDQRAVFLHNLPAYGKFSGLITAPGAYRTGQKVMV